MRGSPKVIFVVRLKPKLLLYLFKTQINTNQVDEFEFDLDFGSKYN